MLYYLSAASYSRLVGVHPQLVAVIERAITITPIDFGIPRDGGLRLAKRQKELFDDPEIQTNCDGYKVLSPHQALIEGDSLSYGRAIDFFPYVMRKASYDPVHVAIVGSCIMSTAELMRQDGDISIRLRWGLNFGSRIYKGWDGCHIEIIDYG